MNKSYTTTKFIEKARKIHGDKFDYSLVEFKTLSDKIKIICPEHGIYYQVAEYHLHGRGCWDCNGKKKSTTEDFIEKAKKIHKNFYDYSEVEYKSSKIKVKIICREHGYFYQSPSVHLKGFGCICCSGNKKPTTEEFIEKSRKVHGEKYDYSLVDYINSHIKIKIICSVHGIFEQTPNDHLNGRGCCDCNGRKKLTTLKFIEKSKVIHGDKYDYSLVNYKGSKKEVKIICSIHGVFEQKPYLHLQKDGCFKCAKTFKLTKEEFIKKSKKVHGNKFDYSLVNYINSHIKVKIICPTHGIFEQTPNMHTSGRDCFKCSREKDRSKNEIYCLETLKKMYPYYRFISNDRDILKGKSPLGFDLEIDIRVQTEYYQDILYIEWNGIYWHKRYGKRHDEIKRKLLGDKLLQIIDPKGFDKFFVESIIYKEIVPRLGSPKISNEEDISLYFK